MPSATTVTKGARGDFGWTFQLLSGLMSALAIVALARHVFVTWSLSAPLALVMDAYAATVRLLLGWAEPYLQAALSWLGSFIGWRPTLYPHWRDVFVLMSLWAGGFVRAERHRRMWRKLQGLPRSYRGALWGLINSAPFLVLGFATMLLDVEGWFVTTSLVMAWVTMAIVLIQSDRKSGPKDSLLARTAGLTILGGFLGAFCFFAIDAGLKLLMG